MTCDCRTSKAHYTDQVSHEASLLAEDSSSSDQIQKQGVRDGEVVYQFDTSMWIFLRLLQ